ncbi:hypothetical protein G6F59_016280 [Rhizopus arrhizus]|nr:hypothetical protein G6F59_016280 [Rhizopus arrhizus]
MPVGFPDAWRPRQRRAAAGAGQADAGRQAADQCGVLPQYGDLVAHQILHRLRGGDDRQGWLPGAGRAVRDVSIGDSAVRRAAGDRRRHVDGGPARLSPVNGPGARRDRARHAGVPGPGRLG